MESRPPATSFPTGREVLVVEDEQRIRSMLNEALKQMGFHSTLVSSGEAAIKAMAARAFDIVILDLNLPGMNGLEFLETARRQHRGVEVIILTGFGDLQAAQKAIRLDVVDFITKPFALGTLEQAMDRARKRFRDRTIGEPPAMPDLMQFDAAPKRAPASKPAVEAPATSAAEGEPVPMEELERRHILAALEKHNGNRAATANELGISLRKLYYRIGEYQRKGLANL